DRGRHQESVRTQSHHSQYESHPQHVGNIFRGYQGDQHAEDIGRDHSDVGYQVEKRGSQGQEKRILNTENKEASRVQGKYDHHVDKQSCDETLRDQPGFMKDFAYLFVVVVPENVYKELFDQVLIIQQKGSVYGDKDDIREE